MFHVAREEYEKEVKNKNTCGNSKKCGNSRDRYGIRNIKKLSIYKVSRVKNKPCNVSSRMNYLQFAFKGLKSARNIASFVEVLAEFLKYLKS